MKRPGILKKISLTALVFTMLLVLSSCGIPTIANFDDEISISSNTTASEINLNITLVNNLGYTFDNNSPSLLLMYNITDQTGYTISRSSFDSTYGQISSGKPVNFSYDYNSETSTLKVQGSILNRTLPSNSTDSSESYHIALFPLIPEPLNNYTQISASAGYTYNLNDILSSPGTASIKLGYNSTDKYMYMTINSGEQIILKRFNGNQFLSYSEVIQSGNLNNLSSGDEYGDYWFFRNNIKTGDNGMRINLYATVNIMGSFSNLYWTNLQPIGYIELN